MRMADDMLILFGTALAGLRASIVFSSLQMSHYSLQQALQFLDQLQMFKIKLGLDSMNRFLARLGNPHRGMHFLHVAGTNGKGSVGAALCSILSAAGFKTGLYTSPHLSSPRERVRIGDACIGKEDFARLIARIRSALDGGQITYFECTTALALLWFAEQKADIAVMEVGMGGRLDATNVIEPLVSVITNVSMDHEQHLGSTLAEIAAEKAGIVKNGIPVVSAVACDDSRRVVQEACGDRRAPLLLFGRDFEGVGQGDRWQYRGLDGMVLSDLPCPLKGGHQIVNLSLALAVVQLLIRQGWAVAEDQIRSGLAETRWPGRLECFRLDAAGRKTEDSASLRFLLDGAHNPAGAVSLKQALASDFPRRRLILVWGAMADKDLRSTLGEVAPLADVVVLARPESERSASMEQLLAALPEAMRPHAVCAESVFAAIEQAKLLASQDDLICISGSLYLVGAARSLLLGGLTDEE